MARHFLGFIFSVVLTTLGGFLAPAQELTQSHQLTLKIRDKDNYPVAGVSLLAYNKINNKVVADLTATSSGDLSFKLETFNDYLIVLKKKGFLTKKIIINSQPPEKKRNFKLAYKNDIVVKMYNAPDAEAGADLLDIPYTKYTYIEPGDNKKGYMDEDPAYLKSVQEKISKLSQQDRETAFNQLMNGGSPSPKNSTAGKPAAGVVDSKNTSTNNVDNKSAATNALKKPSLNADYSKLLAEGDQLAKEKNYVGAKVKYGMAARLKPTEKSPKEQMQRMNGLIDKDPALKKEQDKVFSQAVQTGDAAMQQNDFKTAKTAFSEASVLKESAPEIKVKLAKANEALKKQLKELDEKYAKAIEEADQELNKKHFAKAKVAYQDAQNIKPAEVYPGQQLQVIETALTEEKEKKDKSFQEAVQSGDKALSEKDYNAAKAAFSKAHRIKKEDTYPVEKLKEIDALLAAMQASVQQLTNLGPGADQAIASREKVDQLNAVREEQLEKIQRLQLIRQAYLQKMQNNTTKYSTINPMTRLLDIVDAKTP